MSTHGSANRQTVAVIGAGVSGLVAAYLLAKRYAVTVYEAQPRLGGHAHTHALTDETGHRLAVDTGFIVHNDRTYPLLRRLFRELGVDTRRTEMSLSIRDNRTGLEYAGGRGIKGIFAQPSRALDTRFLSLLWEVRRFHSRSRVFVDQTDDTDLTTFGEFLHAEGFSADFRECFAEPLVSCVWSMGRDRAMDYPARYLFRFFSNHGMLAVKGSPKWYTVVGGSRTYVDAIARRLDDVRTGTPIATVLRGDQDVRLVDKWGRSSHYDKVVVAVHADQALQMLADATHAEKEVLGAFTYSANETILHTDTRLLPGARQARASWNYVIPSQPDGNHGPVVTYWMNRLQGLDTRQPYLVSLNARDRIHPNFVIDVMRYRHPIFDTEAVKAQRKLPSLTTARTAFAGAYDGWGFHEDGCRSGVAAARSFGVTW